MKNKAKNKQKNDNDSPVKKYTVFVSYKGNFAWIICSFPFSPLAIILPTGSLAVVNPVEVHLYKDLLFSMPRRRAIIE